MFRTINTSLEIVPAYLSNKQTITVMNARKIRSKVARYHNRATINENIFH